MTKPTNMWNEDETTGYMCLVDYECELGAAQGGNVVYPSMDDCLKSRKCAKSCGIVEVKVTATKVVKEPEEGCAI